MIKEGINLVFYTWVIIQVIAIIVAEFKDIPFQGRVLEKDCNISFEKSGILKSDKALKTLHKKHNILIVYVFT